MSYHCRALVVHGPFLHPPFSPGAAAPAPSLGVSGVGLPSRALRLPRPARASVEKREQQATMEEQGGQAAFGWAARDDTGVLSPYSFSRR